MLEIISDTISKVKIVFFYFGAKSKFFPIYEQNFAEKCQFFQIWVELRNKGRTSVRTEPFSTTSQNRLSISSQTAPQ